MRKKTKSKKAQGGTSQPLAGSKPSVGDRPCEMCGGEGFIRVHYNAEPDTQDCPLCGSTGVEPTDAPRPGASALGPPAPDPLAGERSEPALRADELSAMLEKSMLENDAIAADLYVLFQRLQRNTVALTNLSGMVRFELSRSSAEGGPNTPAQPPQVG